MTIVTPGVREEILNMGMLVGSLNGGACWTPGTCCVLRLNGVCWASWAYRVATKILIVYLECLNGPLGTYHAPSKSRTIIYYFNGQVRHIFVE